jgi:hypothetical protein
MYVLRICQGLADVQRYSTIDPYLEIDGVVVHNQEMGSVLDDLDLRGGHRLGSVIFDVPRNELDLVTLGDTSQASVVLLLSS